MFPYSRTRVGATSYTKIRFNIDPNNDHTGLRNCGLASSVQVAELALYSGGTQLTSGVATNPGGNTSAVEGADRLIDGKTDTKWCVHNYTAPSPASFVLKWTAKLCFFRMQA